MPHGCVARRTVLGFATVLSIPALLAPTAGCQRLSIARNDPSVLPPRPPTSRPVTVAATPIPTQAPAVFMAQEPERQPTPPASAPPEPRTERAETSSPTPFLDAASARAEVPGKGERPRPESVTTAGAKPEPTPGPEPIPAQAAAAPVRLPAFNPRPKEEKKSEPDPLPIGPAALPPLSLAPAPTPPEAPAEALKASATSALAQPKDQSVRRPSPITPDRPNEPAPPADPWREGLKRLRRLVHDRVGEPGDSAGLWRLRARLLDWLGEPASEADSGPLWRTVVAALAESEAAEERTRAEDIRWVVRAIEDQAPLEITDLRLCRKVNGFGSFEPIDPSACKPGQAVIIYCEMSGLRYEPVDQMFRSKLSSRVEIVSGQGGESVWKEERTAEDLCRRRRRDYYVCYKIYLPDRLAPGSHELRLIQEDLVAGRSTTLAIPLVVPP
ncbi:MAG: hypothetical protein ACM35G_08450 [Planctomycetaceae bacterium]